MSDDAREPEVLFHVDRGVGVVTLNRPGKINAVTEGMLGMIETALDAWQDDDRVESLLLRGAGPRGFCAGGDITAIHRDAVADPSRSVAMWRREYRGRCGSPGGTVPSSRTWTASPWAPASGSAATSPCGS
jgi:enoyl-CoA hydratase